VRKLIVNNITSVVTTKEEFEDIINKIQEQYTGRNAQNGMPMTKEDIEKIRSAGTLPLVMRGTKTQFLFDHMQIETQYLCVCIEGFGKRLQQVLGKFNQTNLERTKDAETKN
jgi:hypothetical protein